MQPGGAESSRDRSHRSRRRLQHEITTSLDATHILTIQGWDDDGIEYRLQQNININVKQ
jgi:hypothetical protein